MNLSVRGRPPVYLLLLGALLLGTSGELPEDGRWRKFRTHRFDEGLRPEQRLMIEQLEALGYATGSVIAPPELANVTRFVPARSQHGPSVYSSGHAAEAILIDMKGNVLHRWSQDFWDVWPDYPVARTDENAGYWRRVHLFENGDLLAIHEGLGILKLDRDSKVLWASPVRAHHDLDVAPSGEIYVLTREAHIVPHVREDLPILEDFVSVLDGATGLEKRRVSVLAALNASRWAGLQTRRLDAMKRRGGLESLAGDVLHTNSLRLLDGSWADRLPSFRAGNVLVSMRKLDALAVVDMDAGAVVWARKGAFRRQHDPRPLANGNLLLFDNLGLGGKRSRVIELDPLEEDPVRAITWEFRHSDEEPLYSPTCGTAHRLANGNTMITESDGGRALEVTPEGRVVWEFYNPHRAGADGAYIATLFEMVRLPPDFSLAWIR